MIRKLCLFVCLLLASLPATADITSDFEGGLDGWNIASGSNLLVNTSGGNPGQHLCATNAGFWVAPAKFLGDRTSYYDGRLLFDLKISTDNTVHADDVILQGSNGLSLAFDIVNPGTDWTSYSLPLHESAGWKKLDINGEVTTEVPTQQEMQTVLGTLVDLRIRGYYARFGSTDCLDNVELRLPEAPTSSDVVSRFDTDVESWSAIGSGSNQVYNNTGGNPGGHVCAANPTHWKAPARFLGNMQNFYNGRLLFDLKVGNNDNAFPDDIILQGPNGVSLAHDLPENPAIGSWTSYEFALNETSGWRKVDVFGNVTIEAPTRQEMRAVLGTLVDLRIRGYYARFGSTDCLDNVVLSPGSIFTSDIDGDGSARALTDALLMMRYLFGFRGQSLIEGAVDSGGSRDTAELIEAHLASAGMALDIDGDGSARALTDALLMMRYLFGFRGQSLIEGAIDPDGSRDTAELIEAYIADYLP